MPVWMVTGGSGFLGRHLLAELARSAPRDAEVVVVGRRRPEGWPADAFLRADLGEDRDVARALATAAPDVVLHAAGLTPPAAPDRLYRANTLATLSLLEAARAPGRPVRIVLAGSAAELGPVAAEDLPAGEDYSCRPADAYGLSKWLATVAALTARPPVEVVVARLFNLIGPGLAPGQAFGSFAARIAGTPDDPVRLTVGDLDARRDFLDVRDAAAAMIGLALRGGPAQVYHVGTGRSRRVGDGLAQLIRLSGRAVRVEVRLPEGVGRGPSDSRADIRKIGAHTGWSPRIAWEQSLADLWTEAAATATRPGIHCPLPFLPRSV
ncbi:MAG TPA: NAD(P)-dependent oxidoreductase [Isosphaeraceae bacterium]|jgi:GDP-4-dehydro-6-deoxy-D-mannose reductase